MLRLRAFRIYSACIFVSFVGNLAYLAAAAWIVLEMTGQVWAVPALFLVSAVPGIAFAPVVASLAERMDRRRLLIIIDGASGVVVLMAPIADIFGLLAPWQIFVQEFVVAFGGTLFFTTSRAFLREIVPTGLLLPANSVMVGVF
ncbi:MAG TPA: MFS transporter, partial [Pseudonocardiaceae bacterium]